MQQAQVLVVDFGSQHTLEIVRSLRELGYRSKLITPSELDTEARAPSVRAVIGSGGLRSVYEDGAPSLPHSVLVNGHEKVTPYLGICYGMQTSMRQHGGEVRRGQPEYGPEKIRLSFHSPLFAGLEDTQDVWMSHGDAVVEVPQGFMVLGRSENGVIAAVGHETHPHFGVQFHPEVSHTQNGKRVLENFVKGICHCTPDFEKGSLPDIVAERIKAAVGDDHALLLFSGGVDSTTVAAIAARALGERLHAVTFDAGHMREGEIDEIKRNAEIAGVDLTVVNCAPEFIRDIRKSINPEKKRAAFRLHYARAARQAGLRFGAKKIIQGTIAPDRIESGNTGAARIKTHHNSAGLDFGNLTEVHPIEDLFKDEVRTLARTLGLPLHIFGRPPFPGPGNFLRVVNIPVNRKALAAVQWAEARVRELCASDPRYHNLSQVVVAVIGRAVGVKGDGRVYGYMVGVRAVRTKDFMTAEGVAFEPEFQHLITKKLCERQDIVQVGFFPANKPPGTTEFE